jgi:hypothetical protein
MKRILTLLVLLAGCAHYGPMPQCSVVEADERMIDGCRFVGTVQGLSHWAVDYEGAKMSARLAAQDLGATHVVMVGTAAAGHLAYGRAYQCAR